MRADHPQRELARIGLVARDHNWRAQVGRRRAHPLRMLDPPRESSPLGARGLLFDPCTLDAQCSATNRDRCLPARGGSASVGYPRGLCTRAYTRDSDCADGRVPGVCATVGVRARQCMPACSTRIDCRAAYPCLDRSPLPWCTAFCVRDEDCGDGAVCDPWKNVCFAPLHTSTGGDNGAPCDDTPSHASEGYCQPEVIDRPTGYLGGQCFSQCVLPVWFRDAA